MRSRKQKIGYCLILASIVISCSQYNVGVRTLYHLDTDNYSRVQQALIRLYRNGTFKTNADAWCRMIARSIPSYTKSAIPNEWSTDGYRARKGVGRDFIVFYSPKQRYYYLKITNCGGPSGCDVFVHGIIKQDSATGKQVLIPWGNAGPALQDFEDNFLPLIRASLAATPK
jgi:hypothetical protein